MGKQVINEVKALNTFAQDTRINGNIESKGDIRIDGQLEGIIDCKGRVVIGPEAKVKGSIHCNNAEILGNVEGDVVALDLLSLKSNSVIIGNLTMGKFSVEPGARINGQCKMTTNETDNLDM